VKHLAPKTWLEVLRLLSSATPRPFVMGGFAEDALLGRGYNRDRNDLDLLVERSYWLRVARGLVLQGLSAFEPALAGPSGETLACTSRNDSVTVEAWLCDRDGGGFGIVLPRTTESGESAFFRLHLPADTFDSAPSEIEGVSIQTVSPAALCVLRMGSSRTRGDAARRAGDREQARILEKRFPGVDRAPFRISGVWSG
jgi:hypothetical protein